MTRASVAAVGFALSLFIVGCREEPTIVIKFEPNDLAGAAKVADMSSVVTKPADLAVATIEKKAPPEKKKGAPAECKVAADCVLEPTDCCDCANGGKQHAIAKKLAAASKAARAEKCKKQMCTMMLSTDPSCGQRADCVDGQCVMAATKK
ncbi:MAG: hypothetical protein ACXVCV_17990 [Polyangia bacterium]